GNILIVTAFCMILLSFLTLNYSRLKTSILEQQTAVGTLQQKLMLVEGKFRESIRYRTKFIDLYGFILKALNLKIVGNFEFIKDEYNIIQTPCERVDMDSFLTSMTELEKVTTSADIPLLYVTLPEKAKYLELSKSDTFDFVGQQSSRVGEVLQDKVDCFDIGILMNQDEDAPSFDEFFFKTDLHCTSYGEFWTAKMITEYLRQHDGIEFVDSEMVFNLSNYETVSYEFIGNTARSAGEYFAGSDSFELYKPKFETNLTLVNPSASEEKSGDFEHVLLNGYEYKENIDKYTYWVTNYGRFTSPYYRYVNNTAPEDAPHILVISDSVFMRGAAYLALDCRAVTILDTRFFNGTAYLANTLGTEHYDAVIVIGIDPMFFKTGFASSIEFSSLPEKPPQTAEDWIGTNGICLDTYNGENIGNADTILIHKDAVRVEFIGWAADFKDRQPLSALYLQIGQRVIQCKYGIERTSVSDHYQDENLKYTGFSVTFPVDYLSDGQIDALSFVQIGTDGTYRYEPVTYQLYYD
ncbi:MAG: hypothetical protein HFE97_10805, partial [Oscillospiraceae bacterium]|nr:hypothetical protein [Oscillospiraceae bacterium]